jgi:hypothetical protein
VFADHEVEYLGFKLTHQGLHATTTKIDAKMQIKPLDTTKKLFSFLCSINHYRSLIPNYGPITAELYKMCEGRKRQCSWTTAALKFFIIETSFHYSTNIIFSEFWTAILYTNRCIQQCYCSSFTSENG